jgi:PAS domain S-box-containing protein
MDEKRPLTFEHLQGDEATETIDFTALFPKDLTFTGSFDFKSNRLKSFSKLLNAIPIPAFLVDEEFSVAFANSACGAIGAEGREACWSELESLIPHPPELRVVKTILKDVFSSRKPQVAEATVQIPKGLMWGRIHFRSIRMGKERFILVLVEDLTLEKQQIALNRQHRKELLTARNELEKRVEERTGELSAANTRLQKEISERKRVEGELRTAHNQLEQRVEDRTAELKASNDRLVVEMAHREEAERALKTSEDKFRTIFQHSLDVIVVINGNDGTIISANDAIRDILGYDIGGVVGKHISILYPDDGDPSPAMSLDGMRPHGAVFEAQRIVRGDGSIIPMDLTATIIPWVGSTAILATFRDAGDRESALEALRESEERYRTLFDQASNAIFLENDRGEILDTNRAATSLTGYGSREILAKRMSDLCVSCDASFGCDSNGLLPCDGPIEMLALHRDGTRIPIEVNRAPLRTGGQTLYLSIVLDITDRKKAERLTLAQRDLSTRLNAASNLNDALQLCVDTALQVSSMDSAGIYLASGNSGMDLAAHRGLSAEFVAKASHLNPEWPQTRSIMEGQSIYSNYSQVGLDLPTFDETEAFQATAVIPILHENEVLACFTIASRTMDDVPLTTRNALEAITAQMGSAIARLKAEAALREAHQGLEARVAQRTEELVEANTRLEQEIAHRRLAEERIRRSLQEKEALLQEVHHRVKNNLQIISSLLALQRTHVRDEQTLGILKDSQSRIRSMAFIHEHLYQSQDLARIDFSEYIKDLIGALLQSYSETGARVSLELKVDSVFLGVGTALPCGLIINELVSNCLKHAFPEGREGEIRVELFRIGPHGYELTVADNGTGLPEGLDYRKSNSLGLRLVTNLTELQLHGSLDVSRAAGTEIKIVFQDREQIRIRGQQ